MTSNRDASPEREAAIRQSLATLGEEWSEGEPLRDLLAMLDDARSRAEKAEADAAAMRGALTLARDALYIPTAPLSPDDHDERAVASNAVGVALTSAAGSDLLARLARAEAERDRFAACLDDLLDYVGCGAPICGDDGVPYTPERQVEIVKAEDSKDRAALRAKLDRLVEAFESREPTSHYMHHDAMGTAGANCPACLAEGRNRDAIRAAIEAAREEGAAK